jgi:hypothetical protein
MAELAQSSPYVLRVLTKESRWEELKFRGGDDFDGLSFSFLERHGLKAAFRAGLVEAMQKMTASGQKHGSVDVIDLL